MATKRNEKCIVGLQWRMATKTLRVMHSSFAVLTDLQLLELDVSFARCIPASRSGLVRVQHHGARLEGGLDRLRAHLCVCMCD